MIRRREEILVNVMQVILASDAVGGLLSSVNKKNPKPQDPAAASRVAPFHSSSTEGRGCDQPERGNITILASQAVHIFLSSVNKNFQKIKNHNPATASLVPACSSVRQP